MDSVSLCLYNGRPCSTMDDTSKPVMNVLNTKAEQKNNLQSHQNEKK